MKHFNVLKIIFVLLCLYSQAVVAQIQAPQVGESLDFGGMKLHLTEQARRDIQSSVDALYRSEKHFNIMLERVDLYMPLIEQVLKEYEVPDEFKYLVIQESALVPDAVSSSNAVGFWQFKEASALELDMRIDGQVDERMNIISATAGAARYLLRSNAEFDNWLYTLQSYMMGQGGASRSVDKRYYGARIMKVDENTHWYVKKFLSYMVAFENAVGKQPRNTILYQYTNTGGKTLHLIAREFDTDEEQLAAYNKWIKGTHIPDDKAYSVVIPLNIDESQDLLAEAKKEKKENVAFGHQQKEPGKIPASSPEKLVVVEFNDLKAVVAREGDSFQKLADLGNISEKRFRKYNDLGIKDKVQAGQIYYLEKKHRRARMYEHVYQPGESLWQISQQYGIRLHKLLQKNRLYSMPEQMKPGQVLWLRFIRPRNKEIEFREVKAPRENLYASTKKKVNPAPLPTPPAQTAPQNREKENSQEKQAPASPVKKKTEKEEVKPSAPAHTAEKQKEEKLKEEKKPLPPQEKLLFPAENPLSEPVKEAEPEIAEEIKVVQKDTSRTQAAESKVPDKSEENTPADESWGENGAVFQEPAQAAPAKKEESAKDEFSADGPVNFIEENPEKAQEETFHQVQQGETLYSLSRKYNVTVPELIKWNNLPAQAVLNIGQELRISPPQAAEPAPVVQAQENSAPEEQDEPETQSSETNKNIKYHTVSAGESMYRVARMYNVTIKDIMRWNNKENFDIREGEQLIVGKP